MPTAMRNGPTRFLKQSSSERHLQGSFAPIAAVLGTFPFLQKLASLRIGGSGDDRNLREMAATLPGLLDMMPSPTVFESARAAYTQGPWPAGIVTAQQWLTQ